MSVGRLWRTVRHLTLEQWGFLFICRAQRLVMRYLSNFSRRRIERAAGKLPLADLDACEAVAIAEIVLELQIVVHGESYAAVPEGKFSLLNRDFDFGSVEGVSWRGNFHEGNNPLRRMNLAYMGYAVPLLAQGRVQDLAAISALVESLKTQNAWSVPNVFRDVWNSYTASHRLINLLSGLALYRKAGGQRDPAAETVILEHARFCAAYIRANLERDLQFNHLMKNYVALTVYAGMCASMPSALGLLEAAVPRSIRQNVLADGGHAERCPMYHILSMMDVRVLAASGIFQQVWQPFLDETLVRMSVALSVMTLADGEISLMNDSWIGEAPRSDSLVDTTTTALVTRLTDTGYVRLGAGGDSIVFDCGRCGPDDNPGHAHADFLSVEATADGMRFLVDTGVPTYTAGDDRNSSRSAAAHNGPRLIGVEPIEFWKSFRVGRRGYAGELDFAPPAGALFAAGWQSGYGHLGVDVRRAVCLWPGKGLLIADLWRGKMLKAETRFLVPSDWERVAGAMFRQGGTDLSVKALTGTLSPPVAASHWYRFDVEQKAHRFDVSPAAETGDARAAVFFAWSVDAVAPEAAVLSRLFEGLTRAIPTVD